MLTLTGIHTFRIFSPKSADDRRRLDDLGKYYEEGRGGFYLPKVEKLLAKKLVRKNLIVDTGLYFLAQILCNTATETNKYVTHFAIGDDNTAAAAGNTTLGNETFRKTVASRLDDDNVANIAVFIGATEANFTWKEWGHFIGATDTANSGTMLSHYIDDVIKAAPDTVTVDSTFTFANAV